MTYFKILCSILCIQSSNGLNGLLDCTEEACANTGELTGDGVASTLVADVVGGAFDSDTGVNDTGVCVECCSIACTAFEPPGGAPDIMRCNGAGAAGADDEMEPSPISSSRFFCTRDCNSLSTSALLGAVAIGSAGFSDARRGTGTGADVTDGTAADEARPTTDGRARCLLTGALLSADGLRCVDELAVGAADAVDLLAMTLRDGGATDTDGGSCRRGPLSERTNKLTALG